MPTFEISPVKHHAKAAATMAQPTQIDDLTQALEVANAQLDMMKGQVLQLQATMVLQCMYCSYVRQQLGAKETKDSKNGGKGKKLDENLPPLLTGSAFFNRVKQQEAAAEAAEQEHKA